MKEGRMLRQRRWWRRITGWRLRTAWPTSMWLVPVVYVLAMATAYAMVRIVESGL